MKRLIPLLLLATAMAASCPGSDSTDPTDDNNAVVGSWTLVSISDDPLPAQVVDGEFTNTVTSGGVTVNSNGTFTFTETSSEDGVDVTSGTWVAATAANTYTFTPTSNPEDEDQSNGTGVVSGNSMTLTIANAPSIVRKYQRN